MVINFEEVINNKIFEDKYVKEEMPDKKFRPSSAGYCERQMFLSKTGMKKFDITAIGAMKVGTLMHEWIEKDLEKKGKLEQTARADMDDQDINPNQLYFEGTYDFFDDEVVYDFKSTANINYNDCINDMHKDQLSIYMKGAGAKKGSVVYIDKRNLKVKQYFLDYDEERIKKVFKKANKVYEAFMKWKDGEKEIPFEKCGCFICRTEVLKDG